MSHHDHGHDHGHSSQDGSGEMPFRDKLAKILDHWVRHNEEHAETFRLWAGKADEHGLRAAAALLQEAARMNAAVNAKLREALSLIEN